MPSKPKSLFIIYSSICAMLGVGSCKHEIISYPGESRIVHVTHKGFGDSTITCIEPSHNANDAYKGFTEFATTSSTEFHDIDNAEKAMRQAQNNMVGSSKFDAAANFKYETTRSQRNHNMRELLFEICESYANGLIDNVAYEKLLVRVIDRTAALHAMQLLLYELNNTEMDEVSKTKFIDFSAEIIGTLAGSEIELQN